MVEPITRTTPGADLARLDPIAVPPNTQLPAGGELTGREMTLAELQRAHILAVLERLDGNRSRAAAVLGIPSRTLFRRLEEYGVYG